jgi:acyl-CoA reductase-like NAD-dependent aldehyde dehydrogenase
VRTELPLIQNFVDGEFVEPISGKYLNNIEPATGKPYSQVADSDARDVDLAVSAAERAFSDWSKKTAADRSKILLRIADLIERDLEKLAREVSYCYAIDWHGCSWSETSAQMNSCTRTLLRRLR